MEGRKREEWAGENCVGRDDVGSQPSEVSHESRSPDRLSRALHTHVICCWCWGLAMAGEGNGTCIRGTSTQSYEQEDYVIKYL